MLVHLPDGYKAEQVRDALTAKIKTIPDILRASLTWDQGIEMREWKDVSVAADIDIYFCDPHAPWQRATCENTNGLLRQYFPKGTDLSVHSALDLEWVATELNDRPRKRLGFAKPIEEIGPLLLRWPPESAVPLCDGQPAAGVGACAPIGALSPTSGLCARRPRRRVQLDAFAISRSDTHWTQARSRALSVRALRATSPVLM